jgi:hypothetical protein
MALHAQKHPIAVDGCFGCKLIGISFGVVPGAYRDTNSETMFDRDAVMAQLGSRDGESAFSEERIRDYESTVLRKVDEFVADSE